VKGGVMFVLVNKATSLLFTLVVIFAVVAAVAGVQTAASLAGTTAKVGGTSTGLVLGSLPSFFQSVRDGQGLVKGSSDSKDAPQIEAKKEKK
jgi:hypothetical protein